MANDAPDEVRRWTAKRRVALALSILIERKACMGRARVLGEPMFARSLHRGLSLRRGPLDRGDPSPLRSSAR